MAKNDWLEYLISLFASKSTPFFQITGDASQVNARGAFFIDTSAYNSGVWGITLDQLPGNASEFALEQVEPLEQSPLKGKHIAFLGSSVTYGYAALGTSFVEYLCKRDQCSYLKEAVNGTTLVDSRPNSYIHRLRNIDPNQKFDLFICQLSTNDATTKQSLGNVDDTDTHTITGAIRYIYNYVKKHWGCPFVMYSNPYYDDPYYQKMVSRVKELDYIHLIDMYSDAGFNNISEEERALFMADPIHPTRVGYLKWVTPYMEESLYQFFSK